MSEFAKDFYEFQRNPAELEAFQDPINIAGCAPELTNLDKALNYQAEVSRGVDLYVGLDLHQLTLPDALFYNVNTAQVSPSKITETIALAAEYTSNRYVKGLLRIESHPGFSTEMTVVEPPISKVFSTALESSHGTALLFETHYGILENEAYEAHQQKIFKFWKVCASSARTKLKKTSDNNLF